MILRNGSKILGLVAFTHARYTPNFFPSNNPPEWNFDIGNNQIRTMTGQYLPSYAYTAINSYAIRLGSDTTAPTLDDYTMNNVSGVSIPSAVMRNSASGNPVAVATATNTNNTEITINEIGLVLNLWNGQGGNIVSVLIARAVLSTPRTLQPNETAAFTYEIAFN